MDTPVFVVTGAPNKGKSTFVKALTGDGSIKVSEKSGYTKFNKPYTLNLYGEKIQIWDTPGFNNQPDTYEKLIELGINEAIEPLEVYQTFISEFEDRSEFEKEIEILRPIVENKACIVYVADCSKPFSKEEYLREVQILEQTNLPIIGILNPVSGDQYIQEWERFLKRRFNGQEKFDPHNTTFEEIVRILSHFSHLNKDWKDSVDNYIKALKKERENKLKSAAERVRIGILKVLNTDYKIKVDPNLKKEENEKLLKQKVRKSINKLLSKTRKDLIKKFDIEAELNDSDNISKIDVFDETVIDKYIPKQQKAAINALIGGAAGSSIGFFIDTTILGSGLGIPTAAGGAVGASVGYFKDFRLMEFDWSDFKSSKGWKNLMDKFNNSNSNTNEEDQYLRPKHLSAGVIVIIINSSRELVKELYNRTIVNRDKIEIQFLNDELVAETNFLNKLCTDKAFRKKDETKEELDDLIFRKMKMDQENS